MPSVTIPDGRHPPPFSIHRGWHCDQRRPLFFSSTTRPTSIATTSTAALPGDYPDNAERYSEFSRAAIEIAQACLAPRRNALSRLAVRARSSTAAHHLRRRSLGARRSSRLHHSQYGLSRLFGREVLDRTGIPAGVFHPAGIEFFGSVNFLKGGLIFSDYLTTVSRKYAQEIQTREYGYGLDAWSATAPTA